MLDRMGIMYMKKPEKSQNFDVVENYHLRELNLPTL